MKRQIILPFLFFILSGFRLFSAPGDDCSTAILISANGCSAAGAYNNTGVVGTLSPPTCFGAGNNNGMWFKFIALGPVVNATVNGGTLASPMIGLFSSTGACVSPFTELACSNPGGTTASLVYSALTPGNTYYIYVDGANNNVGTFQLCLTSPAQPSNDSPCSPIVIPNVTNFCSGPNAYTNVGATSEPLTINGTTVYQPGCFVGTSNINTVYFQFTATGSKVDVVINGGIVRPQVALIQLSGPCTTSGGYSSLACSSAISGVTTSVSIANAIPGNTYLVMVDGANANTGSFELCINSYNPTGTVPNDDCSSATYLCPNNTYNATTLGATPNSVIDPRVANNGTPANPAGTNGEWGTCNGVVDNSIWFTFTTTNPVQPVTFNINSDCYDKSGGLGQYPAGGYLQFNVFRRIDGQSACANHSSTNNGSWSTLTCTTIGQGGPVAGSLTVPAASMLPNTQYYVVVDNYPGCACDFNFTVTGNQGAIAGSNQTVCANAAAFNLTGFSPTTGGTWSGPGITNATLGTFNPAVAGIGTHLLFFTYGPCTSTKTIKVTGPTVNVSNSVSVCPGVCTTILGDATQPQVVVTNPSFSNTNDFAIPDGNTTGITSSVTVSGLTGTSSLQSVCLNINHTFDGDLDIFLRCPDGTTLELSTDNGGSSNHYTGTCFNLTSAVNITSGTAPFNLATGYSPEGGSLNALSGCSANGTWGLIVKDDAGGDTGTLLDWTLTFNNTVINTIPATSFTWSPTTAMTGGSTLSPTVCPTSTTVYTLTATDANGCGATDAMTVTVTPLTITVTPTQSVCAGASTTLTAGGGTTYTWSPAAGLSTTSGAVVVASPTVSTTYTVVGAQGACTNTQVVTVNVTTPTLSVVTPSFCVGTSGSLSASGANTYTWSPSLGLSSINGATVTANPTVSTTYTVNGTMANGCVGTQTAIVTVNPKPAASLTFTNPTCNLNNGVIFISNTSPASPPQTISSYTSNLGSVSGQTVTGLGASSPVITLTNNFGCTFTVSATLTMTPFPTTITTTPINSTCGNANGSLSFSTSTGVSPYTYSVNGTAATSPTTGLAAGTYTVRVRDNNGCTFSVTSTVNNTGGPTAIAGTPTSAGCSLSNGSYTVTGVTGGISTYSYSIDNGAYQASATFSNLASGTHTISVIDVNACTYSTTVNIGQLTGPTSASISAGLATCGSANGTATVTGVTGGTPTYSFSFNGGAFSATNNTGGLLAGQHTVTVKDANSCTLTTTYNVLNSGSPTATVTGFTNPLCAVGSNTATGSFSVSASGGSGAPFTYTLSSPVVINPTGVFSGLPAGSYNVNINDAAGCSTTATVTLTNPTPVVVTPTVSPANCFGTATGSITLSGAGGTPTYSYNLNGGAYQAYPNFTSQLANIYTMGIKDANGCLATQTVQVTEPTALAINVSSQNANCTAANGVASATVTGGTPGYTYSWTGGGGTAAISNSVIAGTYTITATDSKSCTISSPVTIGQTPGGTAVITSSTDITCFNANNGSLTAGMTGAASAPFTFSWTPTSQTVATAVNLAPGTYSCMITDFYGCVSSATATLAQPTALSLNIISFSAKCFGTATGTVTASGSGGTFPYTYLWPTLSSTLSSVNDVAAGDYSCTVTDANNCSVTQTITVTEPSPITLTSTVTPANCGLSNGSATVSASGGTPVYSYTWSTGTTGDNINNAGAGTYTIDVKDNNGCIQTLAATVSNASGPTISISSFSNVSCFGGNNGTATALASSGTPTYTYTWSNGQVTPIATNLLAGVHTVTVTDQAGCKASTSVSINEPSELTLTVTPTNPKCFGAINGFGIAAALGGTPSYTYGWTDGGTSATSNLLGEGSYAVNVTDANGCVTTATMGLVNPPAMVASITSTNVNCFSACNGIAIGTTTNNVGTVDYFWTGGPSPISSQTVTNLCAGTYTLLATDQNSCTASNLVTITEPTALTASISSSGSVTCNGGNNGFAIVSAGGGTPNYTYSWSGSASVNGNSTDANNLVAGDYTVTVTDDNSCTASANVTINQPLPFTTTLTTTDPKCNSSNGICDGTGIVSFAGGAGTTTFLWEPGLQTGNTVNDLCAGNHTVTITSNGSCIYTRTLTLNDPALITAVVTTSNSNCGQPNGRACATASGGTGTLVYLWSNGATTLCNNNLLAGAFTFTVSDANLCTTVASGLVNDVAGPIVSILSSTNVSCFGGSDGAVTTTVSGGLNPLSISWSPTAPVITVQNPIGLVANLYNVTVTDAAGCVGTASVNITEPTQVVSAIASFTDVTCAGYTNGGASILVNGGTPNYTYSWTPSGQTTSTLTGVGAGTYVCEVKDNNGCASSQTITISEPAPLVMTNSVVTAALCNGDANGQISTTFQGGSPGYTYSWTPSQPGNSGVIGSLIAGTYNLIVTDTKSCTINKNFTISEPAPLASSYASTTARCGLANGSATVDVIGGTQTTIAPFYNMTWNTTPIQSGNIAINLPPGALWNCTIVDLNGCSITQTINIGSAPSPTITNKSSIEPLCFGQTNGSISVDHISGTPNYRIAWASPISQTITTTALTNSISGVGTGVYTFSVIDSYGCVSSDFVSVGSPAPVTFSASSTQSICFGQTAQIFAQAGGGTGAYSYTWTPNSLSGSGPHNVNPTTTVFYTVAVSDANGCTPPIKLVTVAVTPSLAISGFTVTKCEGVNVTLTPVIVSPGKGAPYDFIWSNGVTHTAVAASNITVATSTPSPNNYTVTINDNCTVPSASAVFSINVNPLPVISFTADVLSGCSPLNVTLTGTSNDPSDIFSWQEIGLIGNPKQITLVDTGKHTIMLSVTNTLTGCSASETKVDYIEVYPTPVAGFYADPQKTSILDPNINFINTSVGASTYFWDFGDPAATGATNNSTLVNPRHEYSYTGEYNVFLVATSNMGCRDTAMVKVEITPDFALYIPNTFTPDGNGVNDFFQPLGVGIDENRYRLDIYDRWGENIFTSTDFRKGWDGTSKGGSTSVQQGVYIYKIQAYDLQGKKHPFVGHVTLIRQSQQ